MSTKHQRTNFFNASNMDEEGEAALKMLRRLADIAAIVGELTTALLPKLPGAPSTAEIVGSKTGALHQAAAAVGDARRLLNDHQ